jgi:hypothetical protein
VIVPGRLKGADHGAAIRLPNLNQPIMLRTVIEDRQPAPTFMASGLDQDFVASLGNINGYQYRMVGLSRWVVNIRILEKP